MIPLAALLISLGLGFVCFGMARTRAVIGVSGLAGVPVAGPSQAADRPSLVYRAAEPLLALGARAGRILSPAGRRALIERRIVLAGLEGTISAERVLAYKGIAAAVGAFLALLLPTAIPLLLWAPGVAVAASLIPDARLASRARRRQDEIARALPNALDLVALTVEAGLGLEQAMAVVADHIRGPLAGELNRVLREIELGVSRRAALTGLRERTAVGELSGFIVSLIQADEMGAPVAEVLKVQAAQVRLKRRQRAREQAAKTPVKILVPLVLGVFPAIFVVTIGPGLLTVAETLLE